MTDSDIVPVKPEIEAAALITKARYEEMYAQASSDPAGFWEIGRAHV